MNAEELYAKGQQLLDGGRDQEALTTLEQAVEAYRAAGNDQLRLCAVAKIGEVLCRLGQYVQAQERLEAVVKEVETGGDPLSRANVFSSLGRALYSQGQFERAEEWLRRGTQEAERLEDVISRRTSFSCLGNVLRFRGEYEEAEKWQWRAVEEAMKVDNALGRSTAFCCLGNVLSVRGRDNEAEKWLRRAAHEAKSVSDPLTRNVAFLSLGNVLRVLGKYEEANEWLARAVEAADRVTNAMTRCSTFYSFGDLLRDRGDYQGAENSLRRAADTAEKVTAAPARSAAFRSLGTVLHLRGKLAEAELWLRRGVQEAKKYSDPMNRSDAFLSLGHLLRDLHRLAEAESWLKRGVKEAKKLTDALSRCRAFYHLGNLLCDRKRYGEAERWLRRATREAENYTEVLNRSNAFRDLGNVLLLRGKYEEAETWLARAAKEAAKTNEALTDCNCSWSLGELAAARKRWWPSFKLLTKAQSCLLKEISSNRWPEAVGNVMSIFGPMFETSIRAAEHSYLERRHRNEKELWRALVPTDGAKCVSIREALRRHSHQEGSKTQPVPWQHEPDPWQGAFLPAPTEAGASATRAAVRGLREWSRNRGTNTHELLELPEEKNSGKRAFCRPITRAGVKRLLPDCDTVLIQFFFQGQDLVVLPLRRDAVGKPQLLPTPEGYFRVKKVRGRINRLQKAHEQETRQWLELIAQEPDKAPEALAAQGGGYLRQLYEQLYEDLRLQALLELMEPEPTRRRDLHLVLIPDGPLYLLPLHAAASRKEGKRLYEQVASVRYGLSLRTLELQEQLEAKEAKRRGRSEELRGVAFASPRRREGKKGFLPGVIQEVEVLMQETGSKSWWLHGESEPMAVRQNFHERHRSGNLVWVMGHGGHAWDSFELGGRTVKVREPALQLEDGVVSMGRLLSEGYDFRQAELVHFSCCLLGRLEAVGASKEVLGYVAGLTLLGCRRVCSALWPLVDGVAPEFSRHWIRALRKEVWDARGRPHAYAVAFKRALTRFRKANKGKYDHELFWAPYTLYGLG